MPSVPCFNLRFTPKWPMCVCTLFFVSLFVGLGVWQLHRADEKKQMLMTHQAAAQQGHELWKEGSALPQQYQKIKVQGTYLPTIFLLDNQFNQHRFGYNVLSPLQITATQVVLVNRGWIPTNQTRQDIPNIQTPSKLLTVKGSAYFPSKKQWLLSADVEEKVKNALIIEQVDVKRLSQVLQKKVYPFIIRLDKSEAHGFIREWTIVSMPPERHLGYAVQWFAMAFVILILFIVLNVKKNDE